MESEKNEVVMTSASSNPNKVLSLLPVPPSIGVSAPSSSVPNASVNTFLQGNSVSANRATKSASMQSQRAGFSKGFGKSKVSLQSKNPVWRASGTNSNLVISFSDDSSSDDGEKRQKIKQVTDRAPLAVKGSQKPPALPNVKLDVGTARKEGKVAPKKVSLNRTFISSVNKIHGSCVRIGGPTQAEQRSWVKESNMGRILSQDLGCSKFESSSELEDLRQRIAMCETEMKSKQVQKNKENVSETCRDVNFMVQNKDTFKKCREVPSDTAIEPKEPDKKRLKIVSNCSEQPSSSGFHLNPAESVLVSREPFFKNPASQDRSMVDLVHHDSGNSLRESLPCPDGRQLLPTSQSKGSYMPLDAPEVSVSCSPSDWIFTHRESSIMPKQTKGLTNFIRADRLDKSLVLEMSKGQGLVYKNQPSTSVANQDMHDNEIIKVNDHRGPVSDTGKFKSAFDTSSRSCSLQVSESKLGSPDACPDNTTLLHSLPKSRILGCGEVDVHKLFEVEELHDKDLEEAQELRQLCEVEERNALKTYRRAQRALADANARCAYLYRKRELYSAQLRSLVMEDPSLLWASDQQREIGDTSNLANALVDGDLNLVPSSAHQTPAEFEADKQLGCDSNAQSADGDADCRLPRNEDGHNLSSEACSEPDSSSSELLVQGNSSAVNGVHSRSSDQNLSPDDDDDETSPLKHRPSSREDNSKESRKKLDVDSTTNFSADGLRDPLLLEAYLRSKLFSRLGMADSSKQNDIDANSKWEKERVADEDVACAKNQMMLDSASLSDHQVSVDNCGEGHRDPKGNISKTLFNVQNIQYVEEHSPNDLPTPVFDPEDSGFHVIDIPSASIIQPSSTFKSAIKAACHVSMDGMQITEKHNDSPDACNENDLHAQYGRDMVTVDVGNSVEEVAEYGSFGKIDSYTSKSAIDLSWPLCMYELRGRCNNNECPWQHVKDYSSRNASQHDSCANADWKNESSSNRRMQGGCPELSSVLTPPRYLVCLDSLKAESHSCCSLQSRQLVSSQKNAFSISLAVASSLLKHLPSDEPYLHGNDGCVESYGRGYSLYFHCRSGTGSSLRNGTTGDDQALETALHVLNQESNKIEGIKMALSVLSRALEADPLSSSLWIIYLVLYYSTKSSVRELNKKGAIGDDDLFSCAVKHNERSYELWLLYINSRGRLNDRFTAYERAISSLCLHASNDDGHVVDMSSAILDLFLQMSHSFCISGNVVMAVQRIHRLVLTDRDPDESHSLLLSDILECLTISDKCIFWICCVYLVIYRKLPDEVVQQFEFEKDFVVMEWPFVRLTLEEKQQVSKLMEVALDSLGFLTNSKSLESNTLKSAHTVVINHIKLVLAVDGEESYMMLLQKYRNSYPFCLDLVLLSARTHCHVGETTNFEGFEEALRIWPNEVPGIQCIWNQFIQYVLEIGNDDTAKEIMEKWFQSVWKPQFLHNQSNDVENGEIRLEDLLSGSNLNGLLSSSNKQDLVFGLLNLSLYRLLQNNTLEARLAIDKALSFADSEVFSHFVREHAMFLHNYGSKLGKNDYVRRLQDILKAYTIHSQAIPARDPLTRNFIKDLQKPRLRQLVSNILSPISPNPFLVNLVLDIWFGSTLLPQNSNSLKDLVDFVEAILDVSPANYHLVLSVCRLLCNDAVYSNAKSASVLFWASSLLVNTIYQAVPVPPESVWTEAANLLGKLTNVPEISESFHKRALSVYPFSLNLWKLFCNLSTTPTKKRHVMKEARDKGMKLY